MPNGRIQPEHAARLREVGEWTKAYGESIYGTRQGPIPPRPWGVTTRNGDTVYLHVLDWPDPVLTIPALPGKVRAARFLKGGRRAVVTSSAAGLSVTIPDAARDEIDTVVVLEMVPAR
jgi:alpha-L-fucosidase